MSGFHGAALALLAANLVVGLAMLVRRGARGDGGGGLAERVDALSIRVAELALPAPLLPASGPRDADPSPVDRALARSAAFLRQRLRAGDYGLACVGADGSPRFSDGKGHVFVLAFLAEALDGLIDEVDRTIMLGRILSEEDDGLWGFSPPGPRHDDTQKPFHVDADDSAYVIRTLRRLGVNRPPDRLQRFYRPALRLFVTFADPAADPLAEQLPAAGNFGAHPEVNFNVFLALAGTHLDRWINLQLVRDAQDPAGFWPSYFYPSRLFATLLALELTEGKDDWRGPRQRAFGFLAASQNPDGSWGEAGDAHETALAVHALARARVDRPAVERGVAHLLDTMAADGSWRSPASIWEFDAGGGDRWRAFDRHGAYVTARCMAALRCAAPW